MRTSVVSGPVPKTCPSGKTIVGNVGALVHAQKRRVVCDRKSSLKTSAAAAETRPYGKGAERRVVVTGHGVVSSLGHDPEEFYSNLLAGKSGISLIESFDACKLV